MAANPPRSLGGYLAEMVLDPPGPPPEVSQPSYSRAARMTQRLLVHAPMSRGGPPSVFGHGFRSAAPAFSPRQSDRMIARLLLKLRKRFEKSSPAASKSVCV